MTGRCVLAAMCLLLSGCYVQSLNRFYTPDLQVDVPEIHGQWISLTQLGQDVSKRNLSPWVFTKDKVDTYDEKDRYAQLDVAYFKIGDTLFMDFTAGNPTKDPQQELGNFYWTAGVLLAHSLCKVLLEADRLTIVPMDVDWLTQRIKENQLPLAYVKIDGENRYVFTAAPADWIRFLTRHMSDPALFNTRNQFTFRRKSPPPKL